MTISDKLALLEQTKEAQRVKLGLPESIPFSQYVKFMRDPFTPDELFKNGEQGVWLDPSDLSTMFQNVDGTEYVTKDGDPVGLIMDKSLGLSLGENLLQDIDFTDTVKWKTVIAGRTMTRDNENTLSFSEGGSGGVQIDPIFTIGKLYRIKLQGYSECTLQFREGSRTIYSVGDKEEFSTEFNFRANETRLFLRTHGSAGTVKIDNIQIQEITGNHATQPTAAARPVYRTDGELHWLEFDGVDDSLDVNITATDKFDLSLSFNYKDRNVGSIKQVSYNNGRSFLLTSATNGYFNILSVGGGTLEDTDRRNQGIKVITAYVSTNESNYIGQSGEILNLPTGLGRTINNLTIGNNTVFDVYGFIFKDSSQFYPDISKQLHSYMQIKAGEWI